MKRFVMVALVCAVMTACGGGGSGESAAELEQTSGQETESANATGYDGAALNAIPESEWEAACEHLEGLRPPGETDCGEDGMVRTHSMHGCLGMLRGVAGQDECAAVGADYSRCAAALDAVDVCSEPLEVRTAPLGSEACVALQPCMRIALQVRYDEPAE
ncbi:MAG: hypothetical protein R3B40_04050 [Polyangiales bacterium]|nr:hypothetical protein [Myxococcales bacterium]MCB9660135.1 hypothetical protein [Sandaracinaceae bacterium]